MLSNYGRLPMFVQVLTEEQAAKLPCHPSDLTKVSCHKGAPLIAC